MSIKCPECKLLNPYHMKVCWECKRKFTAEEIAESKIIDESFLKKTKQYLTSRHDFSNFVPWVRYGARIIDFIFLYAIVYGIHIALTPYLKVWEKGIDGSHPSLEAILFLIVVLTVNILSFFILWFALEPLLLAKWGTTPGKRVMGVIVRDKNNEKLNYKTAFRRTLKLWGWGLGLGFKIPIISQLCQLYAYQELQRSNDMKWDKSLDVKVVVENGDFFRVILIAVTIITFVLFYGVSSLFYL